MENQSQSSSTSPSTSTKKVTGPIMKANNDKTFESINENKVDKSLRNNKQLEKAIKRAQKGEFDQDIADATGKKFLKVSERWTIRKSFSLEAGNYYYKLYKEVFYIEDCGKKYFETVTPTVYRRIAAQHEQGNKDWAEAVSKETGAQIIE